MDFQDASNPTTAELQQYLASLEASKAAAPAAEDKAIFQAKIDRLNALVVEAGSNGDSE